MDLKEKVAVVTGGTRGIGLAIADAILAAGGTVVINGRSSTDEALALIERYGRQRVVLETGDVSIPADATGLIERATQHFGQLDILVHAAGGPAPGKVLDLSAESWQAAFDIHIHPVFFLFRAAHKALALRGGAVLLISSVAGLRGCPGTVAYQTVKGALIPMARALAMDHGHENIRVNVLAPGIIRTRFHDAMTDEAKRHNIANRIPLRREGQVGDVASAAIELLCNDFITGEYLTIDGGMSMRVTA
ncbi:SDR family NAD(P)-dependent oxidoreductase [Microvirga rosea]|uniref:SDR family NAD(P)-dependent oxidoreductase n=1 Tax=Microvirga rosea TaxID=2715425 RepID=UPI001D0AB6B1|nr:SDR family oxidoreductase [Microvirga rosea]MCB8822013.1 SDR family oxidoreductase [Microvirga rosea]